MISSRLSVSIPSFNHKINSNPFAQRPVVSSPSSVLFAGSNTTIQLLSGVKTSLKNAFKLINDETEKHSKPSLKEKQISYVDPDGVVDDLSLVREAIDNLVEKLNIKLNAENLNNFHAGNWEFDSLKESLEESKTLKEKITPLKNELDKQIVEYKVLPKKKKKLVTELNGMKTGYRFKPNEYSLEILQALRDEFKKNKLTMEHVFRTYLLGQGRKWLGGSERDDGYT